MIEYQTALHAHDEFEVMRESTADLMSANTWGSANAIADDHDLMNALVMGRVGKEYYLEEI